VACGGGGSGEADAAEAVRGQGKGRRAVNLLGFPPISLKGPIWPIHTPTASLANTATQLLPLPPPLPSSPRPRPLYSTPVAVSLPFAASPRLASLCSAQVRSPSPSPLLRLRWLSWCRPAVTDEH
jgi:hypothetical protein